MEKNECDIKISEKVLLTIIEANALSGIGLNKLRDLTNDPRCPFVFYVGKRKMIKRKAFELFLEKEIEI